MYNQAAHNDEEIDGLIWENSYEIEKNTER